MTRKLCILTLMTGLSVFAQWGANQARTANIRGGHGDGIHLRLQVMQGLLQDLGVFDIVVSILKGACAAA